jgi:RNA polymerase sigma-70 factor (ECF subfamily)
LSDADLIARAQAGDNGAWEQLVRAHQQAVFRLAYLFVGDPDEAEDVAQDAFIHAYRGLDKFDQMRPFRPWIMRITANLARNRLRSVSRYFAAAQRWFQMAPEAAAGFNPPDKGGLESDALWQAVRRLTLADQQAIYMRYFLELSEAETAQALQLPTGTVKSRLHRALARLRGWINLDVREDLSSQKSNEEVGL